MSAAVRTQVLGGYRRLLRASRKAFRGDAFALAQARVALRESFTANQHETDRAALEEMLAAIDDAEGMLLHHIVQGRQTAVDAATGAPRYAVALTDPQRAAMRQDEELSPLTDKSADEPLVIRSGNACQRPA